MSGSRCILLVHAAILMKGNDVRRAANSSAASNYIQRLQQERFDRDKADRHVIINKLFALRVWVCGCVPNSDDE